MILLVGAMNFEEAMQMGSETYHHLKVAFTSNNLCCRYNISVVFHSYFVQDVHQT
jgi:enolase